MIDDKKSSLINSNNSNKLRLLTFYTPLSLVSNLFYKRIAVMIVISQAELY